MDELQTCGNTHWFPPSQNRSLDVLVPADWVSIPDPPSFRDADGTEAGSEDDVPVRVVGDTIEKFAICGPRDGVVQLAFWGMGPSAGHDEVRVTVTEGGTALVLENP
jgi:hypothetical protein